MEGLMLKLELQYFDHLMGRIDLLGEKNKTLMLGKTEGRRRRGRQDEMAGWHPRLDGRGFEQVPGVGDGLGSLACCGPWGHKESDTTWRLNWTEMKNISLKSSRKTFMPSWIWSFKSSQQGRDIFSLSRSSTSFIGFLLHLTLFMW